MQPGRKFPFKKVAVTGDGHLLFDRSTTVIEPVDDGWWQDVLLDPRARTPMEIRFAPESPMARYRIDRIRSDTLSFTCICGNDRTVDRAAMVKQFGGDMNVHWLARLIFPCQRKNKVSNTCGAYFVR